MIDEDVRDIVALELQPDEKLLWADKPARFPISVAGLYNLVFSIIWCVIVFSVFNGVIFGMYEFFFGSPDITPKEFHEVELSKSTVLYVLAFVSIFVGIGFLNLFWGVKMTIGPSKQIYAVTTKRVIIFDRFLSRRIASIRTEQLGQSECLGTERIGTLSFGGGGFNLFTTPVWKTPLDQFHKIKNPREVESLIHKTFLLKD